MVNNRRSSRTTTSRKKGTTPMTETAQTTTAPEEATTPVTETPSTDAENTAVAEDVMETATEEAVKTEEAPAEEISTQNPVIESPAEVVETETKEEIVVTTVEEKTSLEVANTTVHSVALDSTALKAIDELMRKYIASTNSKVAINAADFGRAQADLMTVILHLETINKAPVFMNAMKIIHAYVNSSLTDAFDPKRRHRFASHVSNNVIKGRRWIKFTRVWNLICDTAPPATRKAVIAQIDLGSQIAMLAETTQEYMKLYYK